MKKAKGWRKFYFSGAVIFFSLMAPAQDHYERQELAALIGSYTLDELNARLMRLQRAKILTGACRLQLKSNRLPYACFANEAADFDGVELGRQCKQIARSTTETSLVTPNKLPKDCLKAATKRIQVNRYKIGKVFD